MPADRRLVALRHTSVGVPTGTCYGQLDVPVAHSYADDLGIVCRTLPDLPFTRVISSPLQRCYRLATDIARGPVEQDARLMELSFGDWEGLLWKELPRDISEHWTEDVVNRAPPAGETFLQLILRVKDFLNDPAVWVQGGPVLIVTHAGVIRALYHILNGADSTDCLSWPIAFGDHRVWDF
jgi:alpha-ribazole phosphatase